MLILAIDTALDACAAAVLDTGAGGVIAQESQAMKRGHAAALMPLIARVMTASGVAFAALARLAATTGPSSFTGLSVGLSAGPALQERSAGSARYRLGGVAGRRGQSRERTGAALLSARARCQAAEESAVRRSTAAGIMMTWLSDWWGGGTAVIEPAGQRDAAR